MVDILIHCKSNLIRRPIFKQIFMASKLKDKIQARMADANTSLGMGQLDPTRPWLAFMRPLLERLSQYAQPMSQQVLESHCGQVMLAALNAHAQAQKLCNSRGLPLSFVTQSALPTACAYESFIDLHARVPTRDNLHDLLNALVWLSFPRIKQQLNALQAAQIALGGVGKARGAVRDALTLFDENAAIVVVRVGITGDCLAHALRQHDWQTLFVQQAAAFNHELQVILFGHALLEKLCVPYKAITAHAWLIRADASFFAASMAQQCEWIDVQIAHALAEQTALSTRCFTPLPVAGVPGWWPQQDAQFYADRAVFRERSRPTQGDM